MNHPKHESEENNNAYADSLTAEEVIELAKYGSIITVCVTAKSLLTPTDDSKKLIAKELERRDLTPERRDQLIKDHHRLDCINAGMAFAAIGLVVYAITKRFS